MEHVERDICDSMHNDDFFRIFLEDRHDAKADLSAVMTISEQIAKLSEGLEQISTQLQTQVRGQYGALLSQANHAGRLNAAISSISGHIDSLQHSADRLKKQVNVPYDQLETQTKILGRLHEASHVLRQSGRFLQIYKALDKATELPEQARIVFELESVMEDVDLSQIEFLKEEIATMSTIKARLLKVANRDLFQGIQNTKEEETKNCLKIFLNLKTLAKCLENISATYQRYIRDSIKECYAASDIGKLRKQEPLGANNKVKSDRTQSKGPGKAPVLTSSNHFRTKLWQALEWLFLDEFYSYCQQISFLQRCLLGLPLSEDCLSMAKTISKDFWYKLEKQLVESFTNAQPHVYQALQQGLPKMLSVARALEKKIDNNFVFADKTFVALEAGYLEKCANNLKVVLLDIDFPNQEVIDSVVRVASTELNAAIVDDRLTGQVTNVICASNQDLWNRIERNVKLGGDTQQVLDNPNASQSQNITLANVVHYHHEAICRLIQNLGTNFANTEAAEQLRKSLNEGRTITLAIMQQLIASIHSAVNIILLSMHREPGLNTTSISTAGPSFYMKELQDFLIRSWNSHILPFADKSVIDESGLHLAARCIELFVQNVSILRPISSSGRQRIKADCHYLELALKPIVPDLAVLGKSFRLLRAMASLLTVSAEELVRHTSEAGGIVPPHIVLFMLFSFAGPELASPHVTAGWSNEKLIQWLESHSSEREKLELVTGALQKYRTLVRQKNISQYDVVYPLIASYLDESLKNVSSKQ